MPAGRQRGLGILPLAAVGGLASKIAPVANLLNKLGPSHQRQNMASNKAKFDDLAQWAVQSPTRNYAAITGLNPNNRTPTNKTALAWLQQIVNGPGFQGGRGTPFPDNPNDFLIWADKHDAGVAQEWQWANDDLNAVLATLNDLAASAPPASAPSVPFLPPILQPRPAAAPPAPTDASAPPATAPAPTPPSLSLTDLFRPRTRPALVAPPIPTAPTGPSGGNTTADILASAFDLFSSRQAPAAPAAPAASATSPNITITTGGGGGGADSGPAPTAPAPTQAAGFGGIPTPILIGLAIGGVLLATRPRQNPILKYLGRHLLKGRRHNPGRKRRRRAR